MSCGSCEGALDGFAVADGPGQYVPRVRSTRVEVLELLGRLEGSDAVVEDEVVHASLRLVREELVTARDVWKHLARTQLLAHVWMPVTRQLAIGRLELAGANITLDAQHTVGVTVELWVNAASCAQPATEAALSHP